MTSYHQDLCVNNSPATILTFCASVYGMNDITHIGFFDIPMIANIPNLVYLAPTCKEEYFAMLDWGSRAERPPGSDSCNLQQVWQLPADRLMRITAH